MPDSDITNSSSGTFVVKWKKEESNEKKETAFLWKYKSLTLWEWILWNWWYFHSKINMSLFYSTEHAQIWYLRYPDKLEEEKSSSRGGTTLHCLNCFFFCYVSSFVTEWLANIRYRRDEKGTTKESYAVQSWIEFKVKITSPSTYFSSLKTFKMHK